MSTVCYLTDVEGHWQKLEDFARDNPALRLEGDRLVLADGARFVFGGDAIDRGPWSRRVVAALLDAKERYGDRVILLAGNRDINKMRLVRELAGHPPPRTPMDVLDAGLPRLLAWIFANTMGAKNAFEMRKIELAATSGGPASDEDVVATFLEDLAPDGALSRYLAACQLAYRHGPTLFVHGAVTAENLGVVPGEPRRLPTAAEWIASLNAFHDAEVTAFRERRLDAHGEPLWSRLVAYQAPTAGTRLNQASVVYGRPADPLGNPMLPPIGVIEALAREGIQRVVVGHTPSGDTPSLLRDDGFQLVLADNSYGRTEHGSKVILDDARVRIEGRARLDEGGDRTVGIDADGWSAIGPVGLRDAPTGRLVKGRTDSGEYLAFRFREAFAMEQILVEEDDVARLELVVPRGW